MNKKLVIVLATVLFAAVLVTATILFNPFKSKDEDVDTTSNSSVVLNGATGSVFPDEEVESVWDDYLDNMEQDGGLEVEVIPNTSTDSSTTNTSSTTSATTSTTTSATTSTTTSATNNTTTSTQNGTADSSTTNTSSNATISDGEWIPGLYQYFKEPFRQGSFYATLSLKKLFSML